MVSHRWDNAASRANLVHADTEAHAIPVDPLASLEKTTDAQKGLVKAQDRLEALQEVSEHYNADPYDLSTKVRKRFREVKKIDKAKKKVDDELKGRYALPETLTLLEDDDKVIDDAKEQWARGRRELESNKRRRLAIEPSTSVPSTSKLADPLASLRARILHNTARQSSAFGRTKLKH